MMTQVLLDTTFLVDAERVGGDLGDLIDDDDDVAIAAITIAELRVGVLLANNRQRRARAAYLDDVASTIPILGYDAQTAEAHAELLVAVREQGRPRGAHDLIIAATARATRRSVVTADRRAFAGLPGVTVTSN
jgi:tRNA(fMet)-specific endonuclease VapC